MNKDFTQRRKDAKTLRDAEGLTLRLCVKPFFGDVFYTCGGALFRRLKELTSNE